MAYGFDLGYSLFAGRLPNYDPFVSQFIDEHGHWDFPAIFKLAFHVFSNWITNVHVDLNSEGHLLWRFSTNVHVFQVVW